MKLLDYIVMLVFLLGTGTTTTYLINVVGDMNDRVIELEQRVETLQKQEPVYIYMCPQEPEMEIVDPLRNYA